MVYTFHKLIKDYVVQIPLIQRDYAQGRDEPAVKVIRNSLLEKLYEALYGDKQVDFDFVYGNIEANKLIPLDGQQRLTTLFLLHWYLAISEANPMPWLDKFTYETRTSSREFCHAIVKNGESLNICNLPLDSNNTISDIIKDCPWYFMEWERDPTISSMLIMIDAIHTKFRGSKGFSSKLISSDNCPITFSFLELTQFTLGDSIYIRMNARGKQLTAFENFKAKFEQKLINEFPDVAYEFSRLFDTSWTDLFWNYRNEKNIFDEAFMSLFRVMATSNYAINNQKEEENIRLLIDKKDLGFDELNNLVCFDEKGVFDIIEVLKVLHNGTEKIKTYLEDSEENSFFNEASLFDMVIGLETLNYTDRIQFFALTQYLIYYGLNCERQPLYDWIRVVYNLSENRIYNEASEFARSLDSIINMLKTAGNNIYTYLSNGDNKITGFSDVQIREERTKAMLMLQGGKWKHQLVKIGNHPYFKGQIGFLLQFSGIYEYVEANNNVKWSDQENDIFFAKFTDYCEKAETLFTNTGLRDFGDFLTERALLCIGDYPLAQSSSRYSFLIDNDRDVGWRRFLREDKNQYLKELFDKIDTPNNAFESMRKIVSLFNNREDYRWLAIKVPEVIRYCGRERLFRWENNNCILLLGGSKTSHYHVEYYTYGLFCLLVNYFNKDSELKIIYNDQKSVDYEKNITLINNSNQIIFTISFDAGFNIILKDTGEREQYDTMEGVIHRLNELGFIGNADAEAAIDKLL